MHQSVLLAFTKFTDRFEGTVAWMYPDVRNLITICRGNLVDASPSPQAHAPALALDLRFSDGSTPSYKQIEEQFWLIKNAGLAARGHTAVPNLVTNAGQRLLKMTPDGMDALTLRKLNDNNDILRMRFPAWDDFPADAQLAIHSLAWASGARFNFPKLALHLRSMDFERAEKEVHMRETTPEGIFNAGIVERNRVNKRMLRNAEAVRKTGSDITKLWGPDQDFKLEAAEPDMGPIIRDMNSYFPERNK